MSAHDLLKQVLKKQNEDLIARICERFSLNREDMEAKYLRPTFFLPDVKDVPADITYVEKKHGRKRA
jgi:hypothetical protein